MKRVMEVRRLFVVLRRGWVGGEGGEADFSPSLRSGRNDDFDCWVEGMVERVAASRVRARAEAKTKARAKTRASAKARAKQILRLWRRMTTRKQKLDAKTKTNAGSSLRSE
jgi:hypothetical protein